MLVDQLVSASRASTQLQSSSDPALTAVLESLEAYPDDNRSLPELARLSRTTERALIRRAQRVRGISLIEWQQRLRILKAMPLLA